MKRKETKAVSFKRLHVFLFPIMLMTLSCGWLDSEKEGMGKLRIAFAHPIDYLTRVSGELPDTSEFILKITDSKGNIIYDGSYGDCPEELDVAAGSYVIFAASCEFTSPAFDSPLYGDEQCVVVPSGGVVDVKLVCSQLNAGVRLKIDPDFLLKCPDGVMFLKSSEGKLMYGYSEKRFAYFNPGTVSLMMSSQGKDQILMSKALDAQDMFTLGVRVADSAMPGPSGEISVAVDTTRNWISDDYIIGGDNGSGGDSGEALTVSEARIHAGLEDVWVSGYIVGGDLTSSSASFETPFSSRTNILIGPKSSTKNRDVCMSVQLPSGDLRERINLVDNPSLLGKKVCLKGDIVDAYYGLPGLKNITEFEIQ